MIESHLFFNGASICGWDISSDKAKHLLARRGAHCCVQNVDTSVPWRFNIHLPPHSWCFVKPAPLASRSLLSHVCRRGAWQELNEYRSSIRLIEEETSEEDPLYTGTYGISYGRSLPIRSNVKSDPTARMSLDASSRWRGPLASRLRTRVGVTVNELPNRLVTHPENRYLIATWRK